MKKIVVLTGAGISQESGLQTFRDANGLWEGHDVMEVASPQGWENNPELVLDFYNQRRKQLQQVLPNKAHYLLARLENKYEVHIITQNVDNLHEKAGSSKVIHLHGELLKMRSVHNETVIYDCEKDILLGDTCKNGHQLRPHIVWFGEPVPMLDTAIEITQKADILIIVGTSMQVYPAAGLIKYIQPEIPVYFIDPKPNICESDYYNLTIMEEKASVGMQKLIEILKT